MITTPIWQFFDRAIKAIDKDIADLQARRLRLVENREKAIAAQKPSPFDYLKNSKAAQDAWAKGKTKE
jgi:hypothetical protein